MLNPQPMDSITGPSSGSVPRSTQPLEKGFPKNTSNEAQEPQNCLDKVVASERTPDLAAKASSKKVVNAEKELEKLPKVASNKATVAEKETEKHQKSSSKKTATAASDRPAEKQAELTSKKAVTAAREQPDKQAMLTSKKATTTSTTRHHPDNQGEMSCKKVSSKLKKSRIIMPSQSNPKFKLGEPMLTAAELESDGPSCVALHKYCMQACTKKKRSSLVVVYKHSHFLCASDREYLLVTFADLFALFTLNALDTSLIRCFSL